MIISKTNSSFSKQYNLDRIWLLMRAKRYCCKFMAAGKRGNYLASFVLAILVDSENPVPVNCISMEADRLLMHYIMNLMTITLELQKSKSDSSSSLSSFSLLPSIPMFLIPYPG